MEALFLIIGLIVLIIASYSDIIRREVPDFISYGLVFAGLGIRLIYSLAGFEWKYIIDGIIGLGVFFGLSYVMFYSGQWGGGDSKLLMGLGALFGLGLELSHFTISFMVNILIVGAIYGLVWSIVLALTKRKKFFAKLKKIVHEKGMLKFRKFMLLLVFALILCGILIKDTKIRILLFAFIIVLLIMYYMWIFTKTVEESCLHKLVGVEKLTEGDWIVKDVFVGGGKHRKRICGPKDLGIEKKQIRELIALKRMGKFKGKILIKQGIPFVPVFLIGFIITYLCGNLVMMFF